jgi:hypothetical protein
MEWLRRYLEERSPTVKNFAKAVRRLEQRRLTDLEKGEADRPRRFTHGLQPAPLRLRLLFSLHCPLGRRSKRTTRPSFRAGSSAGISASPVAR